MTPGPSRWSRPGHPAHDPTGQIDRKSALAEPVTLVLVFSVGSVLDSLHDEQGAHAPFAFDLQLSTFDY